MRVRAGEGARVPIPHENQSGTKYHVIILCATTRFGDVLLPILQPDDPPCNAVLEAGSADPEQQTVKTGLYR